MALYGGSLPRAEQIDLNGTVLTFSFALSVFVGLAVGLVPLLRSQPQRMYDFLKAGSRGYSRRRSRLGDSLVIAEVALALVIVVGAALMMKSMWRLQNVDLGLADLDQMLTFQVARPAAKYEQTEAVVGFYDALSRDLESIPGVESVGFVNRLPLVGGWNMLVNVWGDPEREENFVSYRIVSSSDGGLLRRFGRAALVGPLAGRGGVCRGNSECTHQRDAGPSPVQPVRTR